MTFSSGETIHLGATSFRLERRVKTMAQTPCSHWRGLQIDSGCPVFLKIAAQDDTTGQALLANEAKILTGLRHETFPEVIAHGDIDHSFAALVTKWIGLPSLKEEIASTALSPKRLREVGTLLLQAVARIHQADVVHADLKPEHILLGPGSLHLCDFGLAIRSNTPSSVGATVSYASPEQLGLLKRKVGFPSDLYSVGVLLLECLHGDLPWSDPRDLSARLTPRRPLVKKQSLPKSLEHFFGRMLQPDPRNRYSCALAAENDWCQLWLSPDTLIALGTTDRRHHITSPSLVARDGELHQIEQYLRSETVRPCWIGGRSGRGKTTLLEAAALAANALGQLVAVGRASPSTQSPLVIWEKISQDLQQQISSNRSGLVKNSSLASMFNNSTITSSRSNLRESNVEETADILLSYLGERPEKIALFLDDLQWADPLTLAVLRRKLPSNLKCLAFYRDEEFSAPTSATTSTPQIILSKLDDVAAATLLSSMAGPLPAEASQTIISRAQGEPFLLSALLLGAQEMGLLNATSRGWRWNSGKVVQTDLRAGLILSQRLTLCRESERSFLEAGAILGLQFDPEQAREVSRLSAQEAETALERAMERHLLWQLEPKQVQFSHDKIRDNLLNSIKSAESREYHRRAAEWLENHNPQAEDLLAGHWHKADEPERAFQYAYRSGIAALRNSDPAAAVELLGLAKRNWPPALQSSRRFEILQSLALAHRRLTQYDEATLYFEEAVSLGEGKSRLTTLGQLCQTRVFAMQQKGKTAHAITNALELLEGRSHSSLAKARRIFTGLVRLAWRVKLGRLPQQTSEDASLLAKLRILQALTHEAAYDGDALTMLWALVRECDETSTASPPAEAALSWAMAGTFSSVLGAADLAETFFKHATRLAGQDRRLLGQVTSQGCFVSVIKEQIAQAVELNIKGAELSRTAGDWWNVDTSESYAALFSLHLGHFAQAQDLAREIWQRQTHKETNYFATQLILARCACADEFEQELHDIYPVLDYRRLKFLVRYTLGLIAVKQQRWEQGALWLEETAELVNPEVFLWGTSALAWSATGWRCWAEHLPHEAQSEKVRLIRKAQRAAERAIKRTGHWTLTLAQALRESAVCAALFGRLALSRMRFEKAHALSEKLGMAFESAWTLYERGRFAEYAGWDDWADDQAEGLARVRALGGWLPGVELSRSEPGRHLAKLDRFDRVLEGGRQLVLLEGEPEVLKALQEQARALLRCDRVLFTAPEKLPPEVSRTLLARCLEQERAVSEAEVEEPTRSLLLHEAKSTLMAPLFVDKELLGVLVAWQKSIGGFFGEEETRLADYLCALAGAGVENARMLFSRQETFRALQTSEQRFRGFFEYAGVGTALLDEKGVVLEENPYLQTLLAGTTRGKTLWQIAHAADREAVKSGFHALSSQASQRYDAEVRLHRAGGEVAWTQSCLVCLPVHDQGQSRYLLTVADTTHRRIAEMMEFLENERRSLAAEVHDEIAQNLSALHMKLAALKSQDPKVLQAVALARRLVDDTGSLMASLRNPLAEGVDLITALKSLVANFSIECEAEFEVQWPSQPLTLSDLAGLVLYRILQEALTNIRKHAEASRVRLAFELTSGHLVVSLSDDGKGFEVDEWLDRRSAQKHFGLLSMRDRAEMVGGSLRITSQPSATDLTITLPKND